MTRAWHEVTEPALGQALEGIGQRLEYPPVPDLALAVGARLRAGPSRGRAGFQLLRPVFRPAWQPTFQRVAAGLAAVLVLLSGLLALSPTARRAVAGWLGLRGVKIDVVPTLPPLPLGAGLQLGTPLTVAEAQSRVSYRILLPEDSRLGPPDEVYVSTRYPGEVVSLVYRASPGFPRASETGAGLLLTQFRARLDEELITKKVVGPGTRVETVMVHGARAFWLEGEPHFLAFLDEEGEVIEDRARLAGNVLLWERGDLTLRIEAAITREEAIRIAESVG